MADRKKFSHRLHGIVMDLVDCAGRAQTAGDLELTNNFFSPSKYNAERFAGKHIGHLDALEDYFGVDLLGGSGSALAREIDRAESEGRLTRHDRNAILSIVRAARERADVPLRGKAALEEIKKKSGQSKR